VPVAESLALAAGAVPPAERSGLSRKADAPAARPKVPSWAPTCCASRAASWCSAAARTGREPS